MDLGGGSLVSAGGRDVFVAKLDAEGKHVWSKNYGDVNNDQVGYGVVVNGKEDAVVTGWFEGILDFGNGSLSSKGGHDVFVANLDGETGSTLWAKSWGSSSGDETAGPVLALASGELVVVGSFNNYLNVIGETLSTAGGGDIFLLKLTENGDPLWIKGFGSNLTDYTAGVALSPDGKIAIGGVFGTTIDFGGGPLVSVGNEDLFLAELDQDGNHVWSRRYGGLPDIGIISSVAFGAPGVLFASGWFKNTVDLGGGPLSSTGDGAIFLARYIVP
jgi:hypothetical protein